MLEQREKREGEEGEMGAGAQQVTAAQEDNAAQTITEFAKTIKKAIRCMAEGICACQHISCESICSMDTAPSSGTNKYQMVAVICPESIRPIADTLTWQHVVYLAAFKPQDSHGLPD